MTVTRIALLFIATAMASACSKSGSTAPRATVPMANEPAPAAAAAPAAAPAEASPPAAEVAAPAAEPEPALPAPGGPEPFPGAKDLADKTLVMMGDIAAAAKTHKDNCPKMGAAFKVIVKKNTKIIEKGQELDKDETARAWLAANYQDKIMATVMPMAQDLEKCKDSPEVQAAFEGLMK